MRLRFIQPGKPVQNTFIESFNGKCREECLNENWFTSLEDARRTIAAWREDYNTTRPHLSLGGLTPEECERRLTSGSPLRAHLRSACLSLANRLDPPFPPVHEPRSTSLPWS